MLSITTKSQNIDKADSKSYNPITLVPTKVMVVIKVRVTAPLIRV